MTRAHRVELGHVVGAHGLRGEIRVRFLGDDAGNLLEATGVWLGRGAEDADARHVEVRHARPGRPGEVRMTLAGVEGRDAAEALRGQTLMAEPRDLETLPDGEYYWYEFIGCEVVGHDGRPIGTVREIWETGAHDVLVVEDAVGAQRLLPTAAEFLREVDIERGRIVIEVIPGLLEPV